MDYRHKTWELATPRDKVDAILASVKAQALIVVPSDGDDFLHPFDLHLFYETSETDELDQFIDEHPIPVRSFVSHDWLDSHYDVIASVTVH